jgi:hypothetical protein
MLTLDNLSDGVQRHDGQWIRVLCEALRRCPAHTKRALASNTSILVSLLNYINNKAPGQPYNSSSSKGRGSRPGNSRGTWHEAAEALPRLLASSDSTTLPSNGFHAQPQAVLKALRTMLLNDHPAAQELVAYLLSHPRRAAAFWAADHLLQQLLEIAEADGCCEGKSAAAELLLAAAGAATDAPASTDAAVAAQQQLLDLIRSGRGSGGDFLSQLVLAAANKPSEEHGPDWYLQQLVALDGFLAAVAEGAAAAAAARALPGGCDCGEHPLWPCYRYAQSIADMGMYGALQLTACRDDSAPPAAAAGGAAEVLPAAAGGSSGRGDGAVQHSGVSAAMVTRLARLLKPDLASLDLGRQQALVSLCLVTPATSADKACSSSSSSGPCTDQQMQQQLLEQVEQQLLLEFELAEAAAPAVAAAAPAAGSHKKRHKKRNKRHQQQEDHTLGGLPGPSRPAGQQQQQQPRHVDLSSDTFLQQVTLELLKQVFHEEALRPALLASPGFMQALGAAVVADDVLPLAAAGAALQALCSGSCREGAQQQQGQEQQLLLLLQDPQLSKALLWVLGHVAWYADEGWRQLVGRLLDVPAMAAAVVEREEVARGLAYGIKAMQNNNSSSGEVEVEVGRGKDTPLMEALLRNPGVPQQLAVKAIAAAAAAAAASGGMDGSKDFNIALMALRAAAAEEVDGVPGIPPVPDAAAAPLAAAAAEGEGSMNGHMVLLETLLSASPWPFLGCGLSDGRIIVKLMEYVVVAPPSRSMAAVLVQLVRQVKAFRRIVSEGPYDRKASNKQAAGASRGAQSAGQRRAAGQGPSAAARPPSAAVRWPTAAAAAGVGLPGLGAASTSADPDDQPWEEKALYTSRLIDWMNLALSVRLRRGGEDYGVELAYLLQEEEEGADLTPVAPWLLKGLMCSPSCFWSDETRHTAQLVLNMCTKMEPPVELSADLVKPVEQVLDRGLRLLAPTHLQPAKGPPPPPPAAGVSGEAGEQQNQQQQAGEGGVQHNQQQQVAGAYGAQQQQQQQQQLVPHPPWLWMPVEGPYQPNGHDYFHPMPYNQAAAAAGAGLDEPAVEFQQQHWESDGESEEPPPEEGDLRWAALFVSDEEEGGLAGGPPPPGMFLGPGGWDGPGGFDWEQQEQWEAEQYQWEEHHQYNAVSKQRRVMSTIQMQLLAGLNPRQVQELLVERLQSSDLPVVAGALEALRCLPALHRYTSKQQRHLEGDLARGIQGLAADAAQVRHLQQLTADCHSAMVALAEEHGRLRRERAALQEAQQQQQELLAAAAAARGGRGGRGGLMGMVRWVARLERRAVRNRRQGSDGEDSE